MFRTVACPGALMLMLSLVLQPSPARAQSVTRVDGTAAGVAFSALRPDDWNGKLVMLVHGSVPGVFEALAADLTAAGHGVAFTTLPRQVGEAQALRLATIHTRIAQARFVARFGRPEEVYLLGVSRGAHSATNLLETSPARYDGMLSVCGGNGGAQLQWDYFFTARVLFDYYFPGVLPGTALRMPAIDIDGFFDEVAGDVVAAVVDNPSAAVEMAAVDQYELRYHDFSELIDGILFSLIVHSTGINDLIATANGNPFDNFFLTYTGTGDDRALNDGITRLAADPAARQYLRTWYEPDGSIEGTPVLLLHTSRDPTVPEAANNDRYESLVHSTGNGNFFVRRVVDRFGHCELGNSEIAGSLADLIAWARTGVLPRH